MIKVEVQHFEGCPNGPEMINNVKEAIARFDGEVEYRELLVDTIEKAQEIGFLGSPTLMINGKDFEGREKLLFTSLNCRVYEHGIPSVEQILNKLNDQ